MARTLWTTCALAVGSLRAGTPNLPGALIAGQVLYSLEAAE